MGQQIKPRAYVKPRASPERGEAVLATIPGTTEQQRQAARYVLKTKDKMGKLPGFTDTPGDTLQNYLDILG